MNEPEAKILRTKIVRKKGAKAGWKNHHKILCTTSDDVVLTYSASF